MAKRGYKLQEFVAHSANVNCLKIGKKTHRNFITGGDDEKVNLWSIGKPTATTSLSGHTSPIESVAFDSTEVFVAAGASSGVIKLWDLEETKVVRTLNGHRSYCTAVEFHPFGEFFASGSMDTNLKIWDIRKKGCIHTYKGHRRAVSTIRFSPDGRWVVSGGLDNVVKIWDLTAGKLLHEFKFHEGHIRSMDFHPLEFLLATGSSDKTVKFWDLETFELIGSTRPEATGVRSITFHPDGRTLFCGLDSSLKVYSWEPIVCHDSLDMGWSTLGDVCIDDGKLVGCSYYQNSVAVWVADTSLIEPQGPIIKQDLKERISSPRRSTMSPDDDTKDIKNIYVDSMTPVASVKPVCLPPVVNLQNPIKIDNSATRKETVTGQVNGNSFVPHDNSAKEHGVSLKPSHRRRPSTTKLDIEGLSITVDSGSKTGSNADKVANFERILLPNDASKDSSQEKTPTSKDFLKDSVGGSADSNKSVKYVNGVAVVHGRTRSLVERFEKREKLNTDDSQLPDQPARIETPAPVVSSIPESKTPPQQVKKPEVVVPVEPEPKRPNVIEKTKMPFEHKKTQNPINMPFKPEPKRPDVVSIEKTKIPFKPEPKRPDVVSIEKTKMPLEPEPKRPDVVSIEKTKLLFEPEPKRPNVISIEKTKMAFEPQLKRPDVVSIEKTKMPFEPEPKRPDVVSVEKTTMPFEPEPKRSDVVSIEKTKIPFEPEPKTPDVVFTEKTRMPFEPEPKTPDVVSIEKTKMPFEPEPERLDSVSTEKTKFPMEVVPKAETFSSIPEKIQKPDSSPVLVVQRPRTAPSVLPEKGKASPMPRSASSRRLVPEKVRSSPMVVARRSTRVTPERTKISSVLVSPRHDTLNRIIPEKPKSSPLMDDGPQTTGKKYDDVAEDLMVNHDMLISSLRSRLTKLQVVRHFFEHNDTRGAINALQKLPDHAVQADVVNVFMEKMDSLTLDLFSCLLPVLLNLLDSKTERHINVSLELLLKLVAVFGPVVSSTISAPPAVGVDLHAEKRLESCNQCHTQLQKIHKCLPSIIRRGGLPARCAQELNVILQKS